MQLVNNTQSRTDRYKNQTLNGINIAVQLQSIPFNAFVPQTEYSSVNHFNPSEVTVDITLTRNGTKTQLVNGNLAILASYLTIKKNAYQWIQGVTSQIPTVSLPHIVNRTCFLYLGGHINLKGDDELTVTITANRGAFGSAINTATSYLTFDANQSVGVEYVTNHIIVHSIEANKQTETLSLGDNIMRIALMSFEKDFTKNIFKNVNLTSDRLDIIANEQILPIIHFDKTDSTYTDKLLLSSLTQSQHPEFYPNTFLIHDNDELDKAKLNISLTPANIVASTNFIVYSKYTTSQETLSLAVEMNEKHAQRNMEKVPYS